MTRSHPLPPQGGAKNREFDSWDALKLIALLLMFVDHTGYFIYPDDFWLRAIGRGAAPIFLFLTGYASSYRFKWDLFVLALLMSLSDFLLTDELRTQNILVAILIWRLPFYWLERKGKAIKHPYEWYIASLAWFISIFIVQYGTIGFLFALCGYLQRRPQQYSPALQKHFRLLTFAAYIVFTQVSFDFTPANAIIFAVTLACVYPLITQFKVYTPDLHNLPSWLVRAMKFVSYYSGYIYAFHLIALEWIVDKPF